jgi:anti-sigma factor RsiW
MNCTEAKTELVAFVDGALDPREAGAVRDHLATCTACAALAEGFRETGAMLTSYRGIEPRPQLAEAVLAAVDAEPATPVLRRFPFRRALVAATVAAALVTIGSVALLRHVSSRRVAADDPVVQEIVKDLDVYDDLDYLMSPDAASDLDLLAGEKDLSGSDDQEN